MDDDRLAHSVRPYRSAVAAATGPAPSRFERRRICIGAEARSGNLDPTNGIAETSTIIATHETVSFPLAAGRPERP
jgi:hypothetical protein